MLRLALLLAFAAAPLAAQHDYHNLDRGHPAITEDAYPVEWQALEMTLSGHGERHDGINRSIIEPELAWGALPNLMFGLAVPIALDRQGVGWGLRVFTLINFNTESRRLPALALRVEGPNNRPGKSPLTMLTAIATRSWGVTRLHLNAGVTIGSADAASDLEPPPRWQGSLAVDHTLWRHAVLLVAEAVVARPLGGGTTWLGGAGMRWQLDPSLILDAGVSRRLASDGPDLAVTLGLTRAISVRGGAR